MTKVVNKGSCPLWVEVDGKDKFLAVGESAEVDGRKSWEEHLFVKSGALGIIKEEKKPKPKSKAKEEEKPQ